MFTGILHHIILYVCITIILYIFSQKVTKEMTDSWRPEHIILITVLCIFYFSALSSKKSKKLQTFDILADNEEPLGMDGELISVAEK